MYSCNYNLFESSWRLFFFFVFGNSFGAILLVLTTPLLHDFYNYGPKDPEFVPLLHEFLQCVALFHWDEELNSKEATQEEGSQSQNSLDIPKKSTVQDWTVLSGLGVSTDCGAASD
ncbi:hypothetical protein QYF36_010162 [Acer negundo]|nr:hypothetical protein QYF36_010162 [Acer negundo]